jgi:Toprim domain
LNSQRPAINCEQRGDYGSLLVGRIWHVHKGFVGVHVTRVEWTGREYERDQRRTVGMCQGGAVWFGSPSPTTELVVGEGIETVLSAMILWGAKAGAATLGTAGLRSLVLPQAAQRVVIAADNDAPIYKDRKKLPNGLDAAKAARRLWYGEDPTLKDIEIRLAPPPLPDEYSHDWNNVLMESCHV